MVTQMSPDPELARLTRELGGRDEAWEEGFIDFFIEGGVNVIANRRSAGDSLRVRFYLPPFEEDFEDDAIDWAESQPELADAVLEVDEQDGFWTPRLVVRRPLGHNWRDDPVRQQLADLLSSWTEWTPEPSQTRSRKLLHLEYDPLEIEPSSAWLLFSGQESIPTPAELRDSRRLNERGDFDFYWTAAKHVEPGDLVLLYSMHPTKAVTHVARAATRAVLDDAFQPAQGPKRKARKDYWVHMTTPIEIEHIPLADLQGAARDHLLLRGSAQFLRPEWIQNLKFTAFDKLFDQALARLVRVPVGQAKLPDPNTTTFAEWRQIAAGALFNERLVERHIVEPLLRLAIPGMRYQPQFRIEQRRVDYVLISEGVPSTAIEVKLAISESRSGVWLDSPDFQQVRWYADHIGANSILIDSYRVLLIDPNADAPHTIILRRNATDSDLEAITRHLTQ